MNNSLRLGSLAAVLTLAACTGRPAPPPDTRAADEAAIRAAVKEWSAAAQAKDHEKFVSFYAEDGMLMLAGSPDIVGKPALRETAKALMSDPSFALSFAADSVVVARSGDMAYETGHYSMSMTGPDGKPAPDKGHYVVVWRKHSDGAWKAVVDAPVSGPPEGAGAATH